MNQTLIRNVNIWTMDEEDTPLLRLGAARKRKNRVAWAKANRLQCRFEIDGDVVYGEGGVLTPGLIDIHSHIGLYEDGLGFEGADGNEDTDPVDAAPARDRTASTRSTAASARHLRPV